MAFCGVSDAIYNCKHTITEQTDSKVVVCSSGLCGNIVINAAITIEYDGYINIAVRLIPCGVHDMITSRKDKKDLTPKLNSAKPSIKLNKKASSLFHFWPNTDSSVLVRFDINSGNFKDYQKHLDMKRKYI